MLLLSNYFAIILLDSVLCRNLFLSDVASSEESAKELLMGLYHKYIEAVEDVKPISYRRMLVNDQEYEIHIKKLQEVNGLKRHNLIIKKSLRNGDQDFLYIRNPLESKLPQTYLTLDEFKRALEKRADVLRSNVDKHEKEEDHAKEVALKLHLNLLSTDKPKVFSTESAKELSSLNNLSNDQIWGTVTELTRETKSIEGKNNDSTKIVHDDKTESIQNITRSVSSANSIRDSSKDPVTLSIIKHSETTIIKDVNRLKEASIQEPRSLENHSENNEKANSDSATKLKMKTNTKSRGPSKEIANISLSAKITDENLKTTVLDKPRRKQKTTTNVISELKRKPKTSSEEDYESYSDETTSKASTKPTTKLTRRTYGRPMVFMGGKFK